MLIYCKHVGLKYKSVINESFLFLCYSYRVNRSQITVRGQMTTFLVQFNVSSIL